MSSGTRPGTTTTIPEREAQALREIAVTRGAPLTTWSAILIFALVCLVGPVLELSPSLRARTAGWPRERVELPTVDALLASARRIDWEGVDLQLRIAVRSIDRYLQRDSVATRLLRPPLQGALVRHLRYGNGQVLVGEKGWLVYQDDWFHVVGPPFLGARTLERRKRPDWRLYPAREPDPVEGLVRLKRQLLRHGAQLVFVPVPNKVEVVPGRLRPRLWSEPPRNPSFPRLVERLERNGIPVYDAAPELFRLAASGREVFLDEDSHWSPEGMEAAARGLARFLERRARLPERPPLGLVRRPIRIPRRQELERLLGFARPSFERSHERRLEVRDVYRPDGSRFQADREPADVVLLGDSFAMVYDSARGRWVRAGLAGQLAAELDRPVFSIAEYRGNDLARRTGWLNERRDVLAAARVVVYEVATRALSIGDWSPGILDDERPRELSARDAENLDEEETR